MQPLILDACCILNLYATGFFEQIVQELSYDFHVGTRCRGEAQWIRMENSEEREPVRLDRVFASELMVEDSLDTPQEKDLFVRFAAQMEDGEAEAAAIAVNRTHLLATDERKIHRILRERHSELRLVTTLELLKEWQNSCSLPDEQMAVVLRRVRFRARFTPRRAGPLSHWWSSLTRL